MRFKEFLLSEVVSDYLPHVFDFVKDQPDNALIHFTKINKLGMNPKPSHSDPIGLYTFPKNYVIGADFHKNHSFFTMPYVFVLKAKPGLNVLNLSKMTEPQLIQILKQMGIDYLDKTHGEKPGHWLWDAIEKTTQNLFGQKKNIAWNKFFNKAGIQALQDDGDSIIHNNEPWQFVFLKPGSWDIVKVFSNTSTKGVYDRIGLQVVNIIANKIFGQVNFKIQKSKSGSSKVFNAIGEVNEIKHTLSLSYEDYTSNWYGGKDTGELRYPFSGKVSIYSKSMENRFEPQPIRLDWEGESLDDKMKPIIHTIEDHINDQSNYNKEISQFNVKTMAEEVMSTLGFGGKLNYNKDDSWAEYTKRYKDKSKVNINVTISTYDKNAYSLNVNLTLKEKEYGQRQLYSQSTENPVNVSLEDAHKNMQQAAYKLVSMSLSNLENAVETYYSPNLSKYREDDWGKWERIEQGEEFTKIIQNLRSRIK